jgi:hypothetical protein
MSQITLRGLDPELEKEVRRRARESGKSLNCVIQDMILQVGGISKKAKMRPAETLKRLAGGWSKAEAARFLNSIRSCEQIDEAMWR